jgi:predicted ATPase with chaperone activity
MPKARTITFFLAAATSLAVHNNGALAEAQPCRSMEYERNPYIRHASAVLRRRLGQQVAEAISSRQPMAASYMEVIR